MDEKIVRSETGMSYDNFYLFRMLNKCFILCK